MTTSIAMIADGRPIAERPQPVVHVHLLSACPIVRAGIRSVLEKTANILITESDQFDRGFRIDCVNIADYSTALEIAGRQEFTSSKNRPHLLILTARDKEGEIRNAIDAGIPGYLLHTCLPEELICAVRAVSAGSFYMSAIAEQKLSCSFSRESLTAREKDVLHVLAKGSSDKVIARELEIGVGTVKHHLKQVMAKLQAKGRTHAVVVAAARGMLPISNFFEHTKFSSETSSTTMIPVSNLARQGGHLVTARRHIGHSEVAI